MFPPEQTSSPPASGGWSHYDRRAATVTRENAPMAVGRFLTVREFLSLVADLRLTATPFQVNLLEFLERSRLVVPVARIRWPEAVVLEARERTPSSPSTEEERLATQVLEDALAAWCRYNAPPEMPHPLDVLPYPSAALVTRDLASSPFADWRTFRTNIRPEDEPPLYVDDAVDTYYHDWQALLVADALQTGARLIFDTRRPELLDLAMRGSLSELADVDAYVQVSFDAPRGLSAGERWSGLLDAGAKVDVVRTRKLTELSVRRQGEPGVLTEEEAAELTETIDRTAQASVAELGAEWPTIKAFIVYLCERWDEFQRRGAETMANEYRRQLQRAIRLASTGLGLEADWIITDVGRVTGHFGDTLSLIFPDFDGKRRDALILSLRSLSEDGPSAAPELVVYEGAAVDLVDWLERTDQWKVHLAVETILEHQFQGGAVDHAAVAKGAESLGVTLEHLVDALSTEAGVHPTGTLTRKLGAFWRQVPEVRDAFATHHGLVSTGNVTLAERLESIASLSLPGENGEVARQLLRAALYRNAGIHGGMRHWTEAAIHDASKTFLFAMMLCRLAFISHPPVS